MAFEIITKGHHGIGIAPDEISVSKTTTTLGQDFCDFLKGNEYIEIWVDRDDKLIGLKPTENKITGFKTSEHSAGRYNIGTNKLAKMLPLGKYKGTIDNDMIIFRVPSISVE